jgi:soluble lytic murein transglycosylase-like protein
MRKFCLLFVLSVVSVFSISAQTISKPAENIDAAENVKVESDLQNSGLEGLSTIDRTYEEKVPEVKKPVGAAILQMKIALPDGLSTGNPTIDGYIAEFSALYNIDPLLIYAQMSQESSFKGRATSSKGASGFMQLMPDTARRFGVTNIYNPKQNIKAGVKYMRWLLDKFGGDKRLALAGYNAGEGAVIKFGNQVPPYRETQNYVARIMTHYEQIANQNSTVAENEPNKQ